MLIISGKQTSLFLLRPVTKCFFVTDLYLTSFATEPGGYHQHLGSLHERHPSDTPGRLGPDNLQPYGAHPDQPVQGDFPQEAPGDRRPNQSGAAVQM